MMAPVDRDPDAEKIAPGPRVAALAGGVGGAKLAHGLYRQLEPGRLAVIVNTADDCAMHGLRVSPDLDTVTYTLAGLNNPDTGWGIAGDTFNALDQLSRYGHPTWFQLGDRDLATHIARTALLGEGATLTEVTATLSRELGIQASILPMTDEPVATLVETPEGTLAFQDYFVRRGASDRVIGLRFQGLEAARPTTAVQEALLATELVIFCPSNPLVSIGPILAVPGMRELLRRRRGPLLAVSPIVAGRALRGPAADMLASLGDEASALGVARRYQGLADIFVIDTSDAHLASEIERLGMDVLVTPTVMATVADREHLADALLARARAWLPGR